MSEGAVVGVRGAEGAGAALLLGEEGVERALPARVGTREDGRQSLSGGHRGLLDEEERPHDLCSGSQIYQALCVNRVDECASVLKSACEGRLVPAEAELARAGDCHYEPPDRLLGEILREHLARCQVLQLDLLRRASWYFRDSDHVRSVPRRLRRPAPAFTGEANVAQVGALRGGARRSRGGPAGLSRAPAAEGVAAGGAQTLLSIRDQKPRWPIPVYSERAPKTSGREASPNRASPRFLAWRSHAAAALDSVLEQTPLKPALRDGV